MVWIWVLSAVFVLLTLLLASTIKGQMYFSRRQADDTFWLKITALYGIIKFRYQIPILQFSPWPFGLDLEARMTPGDVEPAGTGKPNRITREKVQQYYRQMRQMLEHVAGFDEWIKGALSRIHCSELRWETRVGVGEAPETAVMTGLLWGVKSSLLGYFFRYLKLEAKPNVAVVPQYNRLQFTTEFSCIAYIRLGNAIIAGLLLLVRIMRVKGGLRAWQNILFKA